MLWAAQRISLDFLRVSSILHAAKSAAAAASYMESAYQCIAGIWGDEQDGRYFQDARDETYDNRLLQYCMFSRVK